MNFEVGLPTNTILMLLFSSFAETEPPLSVNTNPSKKHVCPVCERQFGQITVLQLHLSVHKDDPKVEKIKKGWEEKNSKVFTKKSAPFVIDALKKLRVCKDCNLTFDTKDLRLQHFEEVHGNKKNIPETNQSNTSSNQDNSSTSNSKTIKFRPSETMKNAYSKKFIPRIITLNEGEQITVQGYNDKTMTINPSNLVFEGNLLSNHHATFSLKENVLVQCESPKGTCIVNANCQFSH